MSWRAAIRSEEWSDNQVLYLLEYVGDKIRSASVGHDGHIVMTEVAETLDSPPPFLRLRGRLAQEIFPAIVEAMAKNGFDRPSESTLRGRCGAMELHLDDLRTLLKLSKAREESR